jgi:hypothetical protein
MVALSFLRKLIFYRKKVTAGLWTAQFSHNIYGSGFKQEIIKIDFKMHSIVLYSRCTAVLLHFVTVIVAEPKKCVMFTSWLAV